MALALVTLAAVAQQPADAVEPEDGFAPYQAPAAQPPPPVAASSDAASEMTSATQSAAPSASAGAVAPTPPPPTDVPALRRRLNRITWGTVPLLLGWLPFEFERALADHVSFYVGPQFLPASSVLLISDASGHDARLSVGARYFPLDLAPQGMGVAGEFTPSYEYWRTPSAEFVGQSEAALSLSGSLLAMIGYSYVSDSGFTASIGFGFGAVYIVQTTRIGNVVDTRRPGPSFGLHANIGWAF